MNSQIKLTHIMEMWVNENIRYFGGDPEKITLIGEASAHYHMVSERLFDGKCIS